MKAAFYTLGCKVNQYETQIMEQKLAAGGYEIVASSEPADVYIINSCTVTAESDRKTRQILRRLKKQNPAALAVLTGCFPQSSPERAASFEEADVVTGVRGRGEIGALLSEALKKGGRLVRISDFEADEPFEGMRAEGLLAHTRALVKIEDGCRNFCSYCIIPYSRGPVRSKPLDALAPELAGLAAAGYREAVLVGINLSAYGTDIGLSLADAVEAADGTPGLARVRLGSLSPSAVTDEFVARLRGCEKLCPHFHLSLQSGCGETLRRMNRHYSPEQYANAVKALRAAFPLCGITTDVIVGFPGETDAEFEASLAFVSETAFSQTHVFIYSRREGTKAAGMPLQVDASVKEQRSKRMLEACAKSRLAFFESLCGQTLSVLFEQNKENGLNEGFARNYAPVRVRTPENRQGQIDNVRITGFDEAGCIGRIV